MLSSQATYPPTTSAFWRDYGITCRPYLCFVSGAAGLVGLAMYPAASAWIVGPAFAALFASYGFGQALTDVFQTDTDALSSPYRPLVRGRISPGAVLATSLVGLGGCALVVALFSPWAMLPALVGVAGLATYGTVKRRWWGGPAWNSAVVALLPLLGALCAGPSPRQVLADARLGPVMLAAFGAYAVFVLIGYLKDVEADRATGYCTMPVRFGRRVAVLASATALLGSVAAVGWLLAIMRPDAPGTWAAWLGWGLLLIATLVLGRSHLRGWRVRHDADAHPAVADAARGVVWLQLGECVLLRPGLGPLVVAMLLGFELTLVCRPERSQI